MSEALSWPALRAAADVAVVAALWALCLALGLRTLRTLRALPERPLEALPLATAVGAAALAAGWLALGAVGALRPVGIAAVGAAAAVWARRELGSTPGRARDALRALARGTPRVPLAAFAAVAAAVLALALLPPTDWDSLMYHLQVPRRFLEEGRVVLPDDNLHVAVVQLAHMLYLPLLAFGTAAAPALWSAVTALLLAATAFALADRWWDRETAGWAVGLLWGSPVLALVAVTPRVDVTLAWYLLLAHAALLRAGETGATRGFGLAGALLGFAFGVKYHAGAYGLALAPTLLRALRGRPARDARRALAAFVLSAGAAASPWLLKNALLLGAPVYPLLARRRLEPWLARWYGLEHPPASVPPETLDALSAVREPLNLRDLLWAPGRLTVEGEGAFYALNLVLWALPLWALFRKDRVANLLLAAGALYAVLVWLAGPATNLRYLIPALVPLTLAATRLAVVAARRALPSPGTRAAVLGLATVAALAPTAVALRTLFRDARPADYFAHRRSRVEYLAAHRRPEVFAYGRAVAAANRILPERARVLFLFDARAYDLRRAALQDNLLTNWALLAHRAADENCLAGTGVTHLWVNHAAVAYYARRGLDPRRLRWDAFPRFRDRCLVPLYPGYGITLYALRPPPRGPERPTDGRPQDPSSP